MRLQGNVTDRRIVRVAALPVKNNKCIVIVTILRNPNFILYNYCMFESFPQNKHLKGERIYLYHI